jgi:ubiquinone/menaquinone biosynthesis C-methylase UbiE
MEYPYIWSGIIEAVKTFAKEQPNLKDLVIGDLGSGITFFPFWVAKNLPTCKIATIDNNKSYKPLFDTMMKTMNTPRIAFTEVDLRELQNLPAGGFHVLYCVSVLEHTTGYAEVVNHMLRILAPGGFFVLTFDVSLDGKRTILVPEANALLKLLRSHMREVRPWSGSSFATDLPKDIYTVTYGKDHGIGNAFHWMEPNEQLTWSGHIFQKK